MERFALLLIACCTATGLSAQQQFTVSGTVTDFSQEQKPVTGVLVLLTHNEDTIAAAFTNKAGKYDLGNFAGNNGQTYMLSFLGACYFDSPTSADPVALTLSRYDQEFLVDRMVLRSVDCHKTDNTAYFLPGDHTTIMNFEARRLRQLLDDFPEMVLRFTVCQQPGESERLGRKRMRTFRRLLEEEQIDLTRILLSEEVFYYSEEQAKEAEVPAIQGVVVRLE
jgi:hypothetical protein